MFSIGGGSAVTVLLIMSFFQMFLMITSKSSDSAKDRLYSADILLDEKMKY